MSLQDHAVSRDRFELDDGHSPLCFPCSACQHREKSDKADPCNECDHNANAIPEPAEKERGM